MAAWFYTTGEGQVGPVETAELKRLAVEGTLLPTALLWREGLAEWVEAAEIKGLFSAAGGSPDAAASATPLPVQDETGSASVPSEAMAQVLPYMGGGATSGVSARTIHHLRQTRPWVLLLSILGLVVTGLLAIGAVVMGVMGFSAGRGGSAFGAAGLFVYLLLAALCFFPSWFLLRFSSRISGLLARGQHADLEAAMGAQKTFWQLTGIIVLVVFILYVGLIAIAVVGLSAM